MSTANTANTASTQELFDQIGEAAIARSEYLTDLHDEFQALGLNLKQVGLLHKVLKERTDCQRLLESVHATKGFVISLQKQFEETGSLSKRQIITLQAMKKEAIKLRRLFDDLDAQDPSFCMENKQAKYLQTRFVEHGGLTDRHMTILRDLHHTLMADQQSEEEEESDVDEWTSS